MNIIKKLTMAALLAVLCSGSSETSLAADSGDENTIPVTEWVCFNCDKRFFTFSPDDIGGMSKKANKDVEEQQKNWFYLKDKSKPIKKCEKTRDGAHFFEKRRELNTSGFKI